MPESLIGKKFGHLTVESEYKKGSFWRCVCKCDCGNAADVRRYSLLSGNTQSCGCIRHRDITGQRFGRLTAIERVGVVNRSTMWRCRCDCGNETTVALNSLASGNTKSCGCLLKQAAANLQFDRGFFDTLEEAAAARKKAEEDLYTPVIEEWKADPLRYVPLDETPRASEDVGIYITRDKRFQVSLSHHGKTVYCGTYDTIEEARAARDAHREKLLSQNQSTPD